MIRNPKIIAGTMPKKKYYMITYKTSGLGCFVVNTQINNLEVFLNYSHII